ncbi:transglutaminase domain-containing protein [Candidatus Roizmanbacteria bacterium]|nr:transglutaminase domain-containing protein [Candidatus Roizmanbacteria bacterium]
MLLFFRSLLVLLLVTIVLIFPVDVRAQDFKNDYQVEYFLDVTDQNISSKVKFSIQITHLRSDLYVKEFSLSFPKTFSIRDVRAYDDSGQISPNVVNTNEFTSITLSFTNPDVGKNSINNFYLEFLQDNLFKVNGNVWEVILPLIENRENTNYKLIVNLPQNSDKKISIAKPKPSTIRGNQIIWENPPSKTVYAVFGDSQYYETELTYNLKNTKVVPVYTDIALPPDSLYQKVYVNSLSVKPQKTYIDRDGNFLARYALNPKEAKTVVFEGIIETFARPREELISIVAQVNDSQEEYLLSESKYWNLSETDRKTYADKLNSVDDIYYFVSKALTYDYQKIKTENERLGASRVLKKPTNAVCMEFTDLFIALARAKGIRAREIEGYGFSQDPQIRPLSLLSDILHSWPEYYDSVKKVWIPVDPTWENTSGIDYFSSLDLNHIAFAIHGEDPEYPLPAGSYKVEDSRDVSIRASLIKPKEKVSLKTSELNIPKTIEDNQILSAKITVTNDGTVFAWNTTISVKSNDLKIASPSQSILSLAPMESKELVFQFSPRAKGKKASSFIEVFINNRSSKKIQFTIIPYYYSLALKIGYVSIITSSFFILVKLLLKRVFPRIRLPNGKM